jgi:tetratricopeptide (TPR) repeat protein
MEAARQSMHRSRYAEAQQFAKAEPMYRRALWIREKESLPSLETMGLLNEALNTFPKADAYFKRAVLIGEQGLGGEHPEVAEILETYAVLLREFEAARGSGEVGESGEGDQGQAGPDHCSKSTIGVHFGHQVGRKQHSKNQRYASFFNHLTSWRWDCF